MLLRKSNLRISRLFLCEDFPPGHNLHSKVNTRKDSSSLVTNSDMLTVALPTMKILGQSDPPSMSGCQSFLLGINIAELSLLLFCRGNLVIMHDGDSIAF